MGFEPMQMPAGSLLFSAAPLAEDGSLQPNKRRLDSEGGRLLRNWVSPSGLQQPPLPEHRERLAHPSHGFK